MITNEQKKIFKQRYKEHYVEGWDELNKKLLSLGGKAVVWMPEPEEHVKLLLEQGRVFNSRKVKLVKGQVSSCHENAAKYWLRYEVPQLVTGWVLELEKPAELWRQHSWLWNPVKKHIIETTAKRGVYFGVIMSDLASVRFVMSNVPADDMQAIKPSARSITAIQCWVKQHPCNPARSSATVS